MKQVVLDFEPRKKTMNLIDHVEGEPEMSENESAFLCGLLKTKKPKVVLEVGVAAGATTSIMLQCLKDIGKPFEMYSIDLMDTFYRDKTKRSGFLAVQANEVLKCDGWKLFTGHVAPYYIDNYSKGIDFLMLDSAHAMPGEVLDFLGLFPFLNQGAIVCLHDIALNLETPMHCACTASNLLFNTVVGNKYLNFWKSDDQKLQYPNIGAFEIGNETIDNIENVFGALTMNWGYMPDDKEYQLYKDVVEKHYDAYCKSVFEMAYIMNKNGKSPVSLKARKIAKILFKGRC